MSRSAVSEPTNDANVCGASDDCEAFNELRARLQDIASTSNDCDIQKGLLNTDNMKHNVWRKIKTTLKISLWNPWKLYWECNTMCWLR